MGNAHLDQPILMAALAFAYRNNLHIITHLAHQCSDVFHMKESHIIKWIVFFQSIEIIHELPVVCIVNSCKHAFPSDACLFLGKFPDILIRKKYPKSIVITDIKELVIKRHLKCTHLVYFLFKLRKVGLGAFDGFSRKIHSMAVQAGAPERRHVTEAACRHFQDFSLVRVHQRTHIVCMPEIFLIMVENRGPLGIPGRCCGCFVKVLQLHRGEIQRLMVAA